MLRVSNLHKSYGEETALSDVSFEVAGNEIVAIIGPSGAGKSTLVACVNRLVEPTSGTISLDGTEITSLSGSALRETRRDIGMVFQEYNLVERLTVMENVLSGRLGYVSTWSAFRRKFPVEDLEAARETLDRVGLGDHERDRADELSGGQRQRVGIARAVIQRPKLLLADEPTSSLDPETSHEVMRLLTEIADTEDIPILINIHEVELALAYADRVIGLHQGEIVFDGTPERLGEEDRDRIYRNGAAATDDTESTNEDGDDPVDSVAVSAERGL